MSDERGIYLSVLSQCIACVSPSNPRVNKLLVLQYGRIASFGSIEEHSRGSVVDRKTVELA